MKIHTIRINKMFLTSMLILSLGYTANTLTFATDVEVEDLTIQVGDKIILSTGVTLTVNQNVVIAGELEMDGTSLVDTDGDITVTGTLDMNGSSRLKMTGDLTFTAGTLEAANGTGIDLDGGAPQTIAGTVTGPFKNLTRTRNPTVFDITATIED